MDQVGALVEQMLDLGAAASMGIAAYFVMRRALLYATAAGSPREMEAAERAATMALGGLIVVLLASIAATIIVPEGPGR
ncbi:MAG: hypothetical protein OXC94_04625 [Chloroflexi bacterium]|nr:hypothetical protein [Chloroflexota bacterium]